MAARRKTKAAVAEPVEDEVTEAPASGEQDFTKYRDKEPTDLQSRMVDWVVEKVGMDEKLDLDDEDIELAFAEGVRLGVAMRMKFQASPENQAVLKEQKANRAAAAEADDEPEEDDEAPAKPARKTVRKSTAKTSRRSKAAPVDEEPEDAEDAEDELTDDVDEEPEPEPETKPKPTRRRAAKPAAAAKAAKAAKPAARTTRRRPAAKGAGAAPF
jgi:hypothetical protein